MADLRTKGLTLLKKLGCYDRNGYVDFNGIRSNEYRNGDSKGYSNSLSIIRDKISKGLKVSYKESSQAIMDLSKDWISAQEIALVLGYSASHVKTKLIPRMILDGMIEHYDKNQQPVPHRSIV